MVDGGPSTRPNAVHLRGLIELCTGLMGPLVPQSEANITFDKEVSFSPLFSFCLFYLLSFSSDIRVNGYVAAQPAFVSAGLVQILQGSDVLSFG